MQPVDVQQEFRIYVRETLNHIVDLTSELHAAMIAQRSINERFDSDIRALKNRDREETGRHMLSLANELKERRRSGVEWWRVVVSAAMVALLTALATLAVERVWIR